VKCVHTADKLKFILAGPEMPQAQQIKGMTKDIVGALKGLDQYVKYTAEFGYTAETFLKEDIPML